MWEKIDTQDVISVVSFSVEREVSCNILQYLDKLLKLEIIIKMMSFHRKQAKINVMQQYFKDNSSYTESLFFF